MNIYSNTLEEAKKEPVIYFNKISLVIIFLVIVGLFLFPLSSPSRFALHTLIMIFMYSVMAQSWNMAIWVFVSSPQISRAFNSPTIQTIHKSPK